MALTVKIDTQQAIDVIAQTKALTDAVNNLSENVAKWQAAQVNATTQGFLMIATALGGSDEEIQQRLDAITEKLSTSTSNLDKAVKQFDIGESKDGTV